MFSCAILLTPEGATEPPIASCSKSSSGIVVSSDGDVESVPVLFIVLEFSTLLVLPSAGFCKFISISVANTKEVLNNISDCIEAVEEDYQDSLQKAEENDIVNPEPYQPLSKEEWLEKERKESNHKIKFYKERIEEEKKIIEGLKEKDKIIKAIFAALEPYDIEERSTDD